MRRLVFFLTLLCLLPAAAFAHQTVMVVKAYAFDTTPGMENGAAYMELFNKGPSDATLAGVSADIAAAVQLHHHVIDGDLMRMQEVDEPPVMGDDEALTMAPGGMHIMLLGLTRPLVVGDTFIVTLHLEGRHTRDMEVEIEVFGIDQRDALVGETGDGHGSHDTMDTGSEMDTNMDDMAHDAHGS